MAIREIVKLGHPVLRKKAHKVKPSDFKEPKFQKLIDDMVETMIEAPGVGLAAPQVAVSQRLIVVRLPDDEESREEYGDQAGKLYVLANPEIARASEDMVEGMEACLSLPGYYGAVDRHRVVTIKGLDRHGKAIRVKAEDWLARVFQHEIDHLDGVMYIDEGRTKGVWKAKESESDEDGSEDEEVNVQEITVE